MNLRSQVYFTVNSIYINMYICKYMYDERGVTVCLQIDEDTPSPPVILEEGEYTEYDYGPLVEDELKDIHKKLFESKVHAYQSNFSSLFPQGFLYFFL